MKNMLRKNDKGITLISLVVMIIIILILATVGTNTGINVIRESKYHRAVSEMKTMQTKINEMYAEYKGGDDSIATLGSDIDDVPSSLKSKAETAIRSVDGNLNHEYDYKYYSSDDIKNTLDLDGVEGDYLVNIKNRNVILIEGTKSDGKTYYSLSQIETEQFNVEYINPTVAYSPDGGKYILPKNITNVKTLNMNIELSLQDIPNSMTANDLTIKYKWSTSKDTEPTGWTSVENGATIGEDGNSNIKEAGEYYLWTKVEDKDGKVLNTIVSQKYTVKNEYDVKVAINFDATGGEIDTQSKNVINEEQYGDLPTPTKAGYVFTGWYTDNTEGTKVEATDNLELADENLPPTHPQSQTLYARWEETSLKANTTASETGAFLGTGVTRDKIKKVSFANSLDGHTPNNTDCWDVSEQQNGGVLLWIDKDKTDANGNVEIVIGQNGGVYANPSSGYLFAYIGNTIDAEIDLENFNTSRVTDMSNMFNRCNNITTLDVSGFDTIKVTNMSYMFRDCNKVATLDVSKFDTSQVTSMAYMFEECQNITTLDLSGFDTSKVTKMQYMFNHCYNVTTLDVSGFDTSKVTSMGFMFNGCKNVTTLDVSGFDTSQVTNMKYMFDGCNNVTMLDVSGFDTSQVTDMGLMFRRCRNVTTIDVSGFDTSKVTDMKYMFTECISVTTLDVSGFNTSKVTNMANMFDQCYNITTLDGSGFDTNQVTNMSRMFSYCTNLTSLDVSGFDTSNVTKMHMMFYEDKALQTIYVSEKWNTENVINTPDPDLSISAESQLMFYNCTNLVGGSGTTYNASNENDLTYAHIDEGETNPGYFTKKNANQNTVTVDFNANEGTVSPTKKQVIVNEAYGELPTPTKEGYTFKGWTLENNPGDNPTYITASSSVNNASNHTLYALWEINKYDVVFRKNEVQYELPDEYRELEYIEGTGTQWIDTNCALWNDPNWKIENKFEISEHYDYNNMFALSNNSSLDNEAWIASDKNYYVRFTDTGKASIGTFDINTPYTVTFDNTGSNLLVYINGKQEKVLTRANTLLSGSVSYAHRQSGGYLKGKTYYLKMWSNGELVRYFIPCYSINDDEAGLYDVIGNVFYPSGSSDQNVKDKFVKGVDFTEAQQFTYCTSQNLKENTFTREGYTFSGWNTKPDGSGTSYANGESVNNLTAENNGTFNLYAQWTPNQYEVVFNQNKALPSGYQELEYIKGTGTQYINTGYQLWKSTNWKIENKFEVNEHYNYNNMFGVTGVTDTNNEMWIDNTKNYYIRIDGINPKVSVGIIDANKPYTITYDNTSANFIAYVNGIFTKSLNKANTNKDFNLLYGHRDGGNYLKGKTYYLKLWSDGELVRDFIPCNRISDEKAGLYDVVGKTFYPSASSDEFVKGPVVTSTIDGTMQNQHFTYGTSQNLTLNSYTREGFTFEGWRDDNGNLYADGQAINNLTTENGGTVNLYAQWTDGEPIVINSSQQSGQSSNTLGRQFAENTQKENNNTKIILIISIVVLITIIVGIYMKKKKKK